MPARSPDRPKRLLLVCLGNICRSPTAQGVFESVASAAGRGDGFELDSAGTGDWHVGAPPDPRAIAAAQARGIDISDQRARQAQAVDFERFDFVLAMDDANLRALERLGATLPEERRRAQLMKMTTLSDTVRGADVPDPYYGGSEGFERVLDLLEDASHALLRHLDDAERG